jgi:hypothetical protein
MLAFTKHWECFLKKKMTKENAGHVISRNPDGQKCLSTGTRTAATY